MDGDSSTEGDNYICTCTYIVREYQHSCMPPYAVLSACLLLELEN